MTAPTSYRGTHMQTDADVLSLSEKTARLLTDNPPRVLRGAQAIADYLGLDLQTVRGLIANSDLPVFRLGSRVFGAQTASLDAWLKSREQEWQAA